MIMGIRDMSVEAEHGLPLIPNSAIVRETSSAGHATISPRDSESRASAASSGSTPITRAPGRSARTATATPLASPPPPIGTRTASRSGRSSAISSPTVP